PSRSGQPSLDSSGISRMSSMPGSRTRRSIPLDYGFKRRANGLGMESGDLPRRRRRPSSRFAEAGKDLPSRPPSSQLAAEDEVEAGGSGVAGVGQGHQQR